jgi:hypothetical protein
MNSKSGIASVTNLYGVWPVILLTLMFLAAPQELQAAEHQQTEAKQMTTTRPAESLIVPLFNSMYAFDQAVDANNGKPPKDAREKLKKIQALADRAKPEYRRFAMALKSAGEIEKFNSFMAGKAQETESSTLIAQASKVSAYKILLKADTLLNREIKDRRRELGLARGPEDLMLKILGIGSAEAGFFRKAVSGVCSFTVFVFTLGYGTDFNYHGCGLNQQN